MKFRVLFLTFNAVIVAAFLIIIFMPLIVLGTGYSEAFWRASWPVAIAFAVVLGGLNTYFGLNWNLFRLLEREDWPALISHLEDRVYSRQCINRQRLRILMNAYVVTGAADRISDLEGFLREHAAVWIPRLTIELAVPYFLASDGPGLERFCEELKENRKSRQPEWVWWAYGFSLLLQKQAEGARKAFLNVALEKGDPVVQLLALYVLDSIADPRDRETVDAGRERFRSLFTHEKWISELDRRQGELHVLVLTRLISDATVWAFPEGEDDHA